MEILIQTCCTFGVLLSHLVVKGQVLGSPRWDVRRDLGRAGSGHGPHQNRGWAGVGRERHQSQPQFPRLHRGALQPLPVPFDGRGCVHPPRVRAPWRQRTPRPPPLGGLWLQPHPTPGTRPRATVEQVSRPQPRTRKPGAFLYGADGLACRDRPRAQTLSSRLLPDRVLRQGSGRRLRDLSPLWLQAGKG